jgi:hypothetical protein
MTDDSSVEAVYETVENRTGQRRNGVMVALVGASLALATVLGFSALITTSDKTEQNADIAKAIQAERTRSIRVSCEQENARNHNAVAQVRKRYRSLPPAERRAGRDSRNYTIVLIDALVPVQDCDRLVARSVIEGRP